MIIPLQLLPVGDTKDSLYMMKLFLEEHNQISRHAECHVDYEVY